MREATPTERTRHVEVTYTARESREIYVNFTCPSRSFLVGRQVSDLRGRVDFGDRIGRFVPLGA